MEAARLLSRVPPFCSEKVFALPATDLHNDASGVSISVQCCFASSGVRPCHVLFYVNELDLRAGEHFHLAFRLDVHQETFSSATIPL